LSRAVDVEVGEDPKDREVELSSSLTTGSLDISKRLLLLPLLELELLLL
jgi:hypothetical protein